MRTRLALVSAAAVLLAAAAAPAQTPPGGGGGGGGGGPGRQGFGERRMQMLLKDITLSTEQQAKVDSIRTRYRTQMRAFTPGGPPDSATREKMRDVLRHEDDEIRAVLTADQQKTWDRNVGEMRARRSGRG